MSEEKIIRTALDPTPSGESTWEFDMENDPTVLKKKEIAEKFIIKHGLPKSFYDAMENRAKRVSSDKKTAG